MHDLGLRLNTRNGEKSTLALIIQPLYRVDRTPDFPSLVKSVTHFYRLKREDPFKYQKKADVPLIPGKQKLSTSQNFGVLFTEVSTLLEAADFVLREKGSLRSREAKDGERTTYHYCILKK